MEKRAEMFDADGAPVRTLCGMMFGAETERYTIGETVEWLGETYYVQDAEIDKNECIGLYNGNSGSVRAPVIEIGR